MLVACCAVTSARTPVFKSTAGGSHTRSSRKRSPEPDKPFSTVKNKNKKRNKKASSDLDMFQSMFEKFGPVPGAGDAADEDGSDSQLSALTEEESEHSQPSSVAADTSEQSGSEEEEDESGDEEGEVDISEEGDEDPFALPKAKSRKRSRSKARGFDEFDAEGSGFEEVSSVELDFDADPETGGRMDATVKSVASALSCFSCWTDESVGAAEQEGVPRQGEGSQAGCQADAQGFPRV